MTDVSRTLATGGRLRAYNVHLTTLRDSVLHSKSDCLFARLQDSFMSVDRGKDCLTSQVVWPVLCIAPTSPLSHIKGRSGQPETSSTSIADHSR